MENKTDHPSLSLPWRAKLVAYTELLKLRLSFLVTFSAAFGYILASRGQIHWLNLLLFSFGGLMVSGASAAINQIMEQDYDALMRRTRNRPLPTGRLNGREAAAFSAWVALIGFLTLYIASNPVTLLLSFLSFVLYGLVYTPMKRVGPIAVFVGAFPGALPPLLGWAAATGDVTYEALIIFGIQFIWQFPHFWAIAWVSDEDYKKAGFRLLPNGGRKDLNTAINLMIYTLFLLPLGLLPTYFGMTGIHSGVIATLCGCGFLAQTFLLMKNHSDQAARKIMFGSFLYLPIVQIAYMLDKI